MKIQIKKVQTIETEIYAIEEQDFSSNNGNQTSIIILKTTAGNFTNYKQVWEKLKVDAERLNIGDKVLINYTTFFDEKDSSTNTNCPTVANICNAFYFLRGECFFI